MKMLLIVFMIAYLVNVSNGIFPWWLMPRKEPWYNFWRPPATRTSIIMNKLYNRGKDFVLYNRGHQFKFWDGIFRMAHIMYLGICPEKVTTTSTTTPYPGWRPRKTTAKPKN
ncbi:uncharacterized protein LOC133521799 isoform X2 [Cydia pomonella]|uniref:uncharacterized protein LOC133521799 isoform X2 n=1 Tax=Cydia pomonella TaxID=82600 RepID=UPI002ADD49D6|nr:uncharacterized protein LOC133521799 isoform X2 [Cydia pomonella]